MVDDREGKAALLYVEDELETRELLSAVLAHRFPDVLLHAAGNGAEGLELFRQFRPQLVVTDIRMPVMDGLQMASMIRELDVQVDLIALTAYDDQKFLEQAESIGFSDYIMKPINYKVLFASIERSLARQE